MAFWNRNVLCLASIFLSYYYISGAHSLVSTNITSELQIRYICLRILFHMSLYVLTLYHSFAVHNRPHTKVTPSTYRFIES